MTYTFTQISEQIELALSQYQHYFVGKPTELYEPIRYILSNGGKRLRPALVLLSCNLFTDKIEAATPSAVGLEVFHNFTLLHDDIMDKADMRRGNPTVHKKWNQNIAILSGDAMLIQAYKCISDMNILHLPSVLQLFNQTAIEVCEGQQWDMNFETAENVTVDDYLEMIRLKTSVLIAAACKMGALIGNASNKDTDLLYHFGLNIGIAFQLKDDLLDAFGDEKIFGKKNGGDILSDKKTYLLLKAKELADTNNLLKINQLIGNINISDENKIKSVLDIYQQLNVKQHTEKLINQYFDKAINALNEVSVANQNKTELLKLAEYLMQREK